MNRQRASAVAVLGAQYYVQGRAEVQWNINRIICVFLRQRESEKKGKNRIVLEIRAMQAEDLEAVARTESQIFPAHGAEKDLKMHCVRKRRSIWLHMKRKYWQDIADCCSLLMRLISQT